MEQKEESELQPQIDHLTAEGQVGSKQWVDQQQVSRDESNPVLSAAAEQVGDGDCKEADLQSPVHRSEQLDCGTEQSTMDHDGDTRIEARHPSGVQQAAGAVGSEQQPKARPVRAGSLAEQLRASEQSKVAVLAGLKHSIEQGVASLAQHFASEGLISIEHGEQAIHATQLLAALRHQVEEAQKQGQMAATHTVSEPAVAEVVVAALPDVAGQQTSTAAHQQPAQRSSDNKQARVDQLEKQLAEREQSVQSLGLLLGHQERIIATKQRREKEMQQRLRAVQHELEGCQQQQLLGQSMIHTLNQQLHEAKASEVGWTRESRALHEQLGKTVSQLEAAKRKAEQVQRVLADAQKQLISPTSAVVATLRAEKLALQRCLERERHVHNRQRTVLQTHITELEQQVEDMQSERSPNARTADHTHDETKDEARDSEDRQRHSMAHTGMDEAAGEGAMRATSELSRTEEQLEEVIRRSTSDMWHQQHESDSVQSDWADKTRHRRRERSSKRQRRHREAPSQHHEEQHEEGQEDEQPAALGRPTHQRFSSV